MANLRSHELDFYQVAEQNVDALKAEQSRDPVRRVGTPDHSVLVLEARQTALQRRARAPGVAMALNRDGLIHTLYNGRGNWNNAIPWALHEWWLDPRGPTWAQCEVLRLQPAEARQLLAAAGYPDGLRVDLISTPGYGQVWAQAVELMQQDLKSAGIHASIKNAGVHGLRNDDVQRAIRRWQRAGVRARVAVQRTARLPVQYVPPNGARNHAGVNDPS